MFNDRRFATKQMQGVFFNLSTLFCLIHTPC